MAYQLSTAREGALKVMLSELSSSEDLRRRFEQEAKVGAQIDSEHVVELVGAGIDAVSNSPWLAMELLVGQDLNAYLLEQGTLSAGVMLEVFDQPDQAVTACVTKAFFRLSFSAA